MERKNLSVTFHARTYNIINPRLKNNSTSFINFTSPLAQYISINIHNYIHSPPKTYCQVIDSNSKACIFERTSPFRARVSPFLYSAMWIPPKKKKKKKKCAPLTREWTSQTEEFNFVYQFYLTSPRYFNFKIALPTRTIHLN